MVPIGSATTDDTLIALVADGDERAFDEIDRRYRSLLIARAAPIVGPHEAEDVAQDALVAAQREIVRGSRPAALGIWLLTVARNRAIDVQRTRRGSREGSAEGSAPTQDTPAAHSPSPAETLEVREELRDVVIAISGLPALQRSALVAQSFEGKANEEIAAEHDTSTGAVRMALYRGRTQLRERLAVFSPVPLFLGFKSMVGRIRDAGPVASGGAATVGIAAVAVSVALATGIGGNGRGGERTAVASADQPPARSHASGNNSNSTSEPRKAAAKPDRAAKRTPTAGSQARDPQQSLRSAPPGAAPPADSGAPAAPAPGSSEQSQQPSSEVEASPEPQQQTPDPPTPEPQPEPTPQPEPAPPPPAPEPTPEPPAPTPQPTQPGSQACSGLLPCVVDVVDQILGPRGG